MSYFQSKGKRKGIHVYKNYYTKTRSRDSAVGMATGYRLDDRGVGVRIPVGSRNFLFSTSCPDPAFYPMGTAGPFLEGKVAGA
jgi:hypothetical protein